MPRNMSVSLGDHFMAFINERVVSGRFNSASDVVRAGLRLLEEHEAKVEAVHGALPGGEESGWATPLDPDVSTAGVMASPSFRIKITSACLPGVMEPTRSAMPIAWALLMVAQASASRAEKERAGVL